MMFNLGIPKLLRSFCFRKATPLIYPSDWPSELHSKCSVPACWYPNPPQAAVGQYNCLGHRSDDQPCRGVYMINASMAYAIVEDYHRKRKAELIQEKNRFLEEKRERESQTQRRNVEKKPSRPSTLARISQKALKECGFRGLDYRKDKSLPGIPGLSQRKINRRPNSPPLPIPTYTRTEPRAEVRVHCYFPKELSETQPTPDFVINYQRPEFASQRIPPAALPRTRNLSRDLGFTSASRSSLSVYSQKTHYGWYF